MELTAYLVILRRRAVALVLCLVAGAIGGYYAGHHPHKVYEATSRTFINIPLGAGSTLQDALAGTQISGNLVKTYASIASSQVVAQHIVDDLHLSESANSVKHQMKAGAEQDTFIIDIAAKDQSPQRAQSLANAASAALQDTIAQLEAGKSDPVRANLIDAATLPTSPVSPSPNKDLALGLIFGLLAGVALMAVLEALDRSIKSVTEAESALGVPALALVPRGRRRGGRVPLATNPGSAAGEPYRALRTALRAFSFPDSDRPIRTLLVTSPTPRDGKTTTAANLAAAFALDGERVVVIDANLRRAELAEVFHLDPGTGLTSVLTSEVKVSAALQQPIGNGQPDVLTSGPPAPNPSELLGSAAMAALVDSLAGSYGMVIIDTPPVLPVSDAVALSPHVDAVVMVLREGHTQRHAAAEAARRLHAVGANLVGFVINSLPSSEVRDLYPDYRPVYATLPDGKRRRGSRARAKSTSAPPAAS